ncbi:MAG: PASTA domain-containing protein [Bacteroidales bacterium]|nr:PASTA domain-containing protein [Bacteroidales bacterium]MBN2750647.1 PASTA domain-containing protein [Bacteroidales bacterium]
MSNNSPRFKEKINALLNTMLKNVYVKNILIALGISVVSFFLVFLFLNIFTRHGRTYPVPDFVGLNKNEVAQLARKHDLRVSITDSVFIMTRRPGTIIEQTPEPGTMVKSNRKIFFIVNALNPQKVEMPNIVGVTLRQAKAMLDLQGLTIGKLDFIADIAVNNVMEQRHNGSEVEPGQMIPKGSTIDLLLGRGLRGEQTALPPLIGLKLHEAKNLLIEASLNLGPVRFDETVETYKDSIEAKVYSQYPAYDGPRSISFGARVELWLTLNESRIPKPKVDGIIDSTYIKILEEEPIEEVLE